jgi:uncharacterized protein
MKLLVVVLALLLLVWLLLGSARRRSKDPRRGPAPAKPTPPPAVEGMVACAHCGVHLPSSQALALGGQRYCSAVHRDAGPHAT